MKKALLILTLCTQPGAAKDFEPVTVDIWSGKARIVSGSARVELAAEPLLLTVTYGGEARVSGPAGDRIDFWNRSRVIRGPKTAREDVPLSRFPVYIRKGAAFTFAVPK